MGGVGLVLMVMSLVVVMAQSEDWGQTLGLGKEKVSQLHFYLHEISTGENPTVVKVAGPKNANSSTLFGTMWIEDSPLREGPKPTSALVGRAQGLTGADNREEFGLFMAMDFGFTRGKYDGSSLSIVGRNRASEPVREVPIVGGTGVFRLARGFAIVKTYALDPAAGLTIIEYNVTVVCYASE